MKNKIKIIKISILLILLNTSACQSNTKSKVSVSNVVSYFKDKKYEFPLCIKKDSIQIGYYLDTALIKSENTVSLYPDIGLIESSFSKYVDFETLMKKTLLVDYSERNEFGYVISQPRILIDTFFEGTKKNPMLYLSLIVDKYFPETPNIKLPCEDCSIIEDYKIQKKSGWLLLTLDSSKNHLVFHRWND